MSERTWLSKESTTTTKNLMTSPFQLKKRILPLIEEYTTEELLLAAETSLRHAGRRDAASILHEAAGTSTRVTKIKHSRKFSEEENNLKFSRDYSLFAYI